MPTFSYRRRWKGQVRQASMCIVRLQVTKFLRAEVSTEWKYDLLQCPGHVTAICPASVIGPGVDDVILRCGSICECTATIDTLIRDDRDSEWRLYAVVAALVVCLVHHVLFPTREDHATSSLVSYQFAHVPLGSLPIESEGVVLSIKVSLNFRLDNAVVGMSLTSVRWKASLASSVVKNGYHTEVLFLPKFEDILRARQSREQMQVFRKSHCVRVRFWCQKTLCRKRLCHVWKLSPYCRHCL